MTKVLLHTTALLVTLALPMVAYGAPTPTAETAPVARKVIHGCYMIPIPNTNAWQKVDATCVFNTGFNEDGSGIPRYFNDTLLDMLKPIGQPVDPDDDKNPPDGDDDTPDGDDDDDTPDGDDDDDNGHGNDDDGHDDDNPGNGDDDNGGNPCGGNCGNGGGNGGGNGTGNEGGGVGPKK